MGRMTAISYKPYRGYQLEMRDAGGANCAVVIHPPEGRGAAQPVSPGDGQPASLGGLIERAKAVVDAVLGPRPPVSARSARTGHRSW